MTVYNTYLIVPAMTDQAGQCRIVVATHVDNVHLGLKDYRANPDMWKDCGIMASDGHIVCIDVSHPSHRNGMKRDEPLAAGVTYRFIAGEDREV